MLSSTRRAAAHATAAQTPCAAEAIRYSRGEIGEPGFRRLISMQNRSLSTFLIVHHKVDREPRAARPPWIGWIGGIADEAARIVAHGAVRSGRCQPREFVRRDMTDDTMAALRETLLDRLLHFTTRTDLSVTARVEETSAEFEPTSS